LQRSFNALFFQKGSGSVNKIVRKLAFDHLKWNRKKTFLEILIIALISASVFFVNLTLPRIRSVYRSWCLNRYGAWYAYAEIPDESYRLCRMVLDGEDAQNGLKDLRSPENRTGSVSENDLLHYGWLFHQGTWNDFTVAHADSWLYDLCRLDLLEGSFPLSGQDIAVTDQIRDQYGLSIGSSLKLTVNGNESEYTVTGILRKSQDLFPDIYTAEEGGHAFYFFDRMFSYSIPGTNTIRITSFGLSLPYTENRFGFDHYTKLNDEHRYYKETTAFNDNSMIRLVTVLSAALFLFLVRTAGEKKRARELTVLRAAGMTSPQVISMTMLETLVTGTIGTVSGLMISFLLTVIAEAWMTLFMNADAAPLWMDYTGNPGLCAGAGLLVLLFCFIGAWLPVLRASQNALSGSFEEVYQGKKKKHRVKLRYMNTGRRAFHRLNYRKGFWAGMSALAAFLCMIALPEKQNDAFEAGGSMRGTYEIRFDSMHYVAFMLNDLDDSSILDSLPAEVRFMEAGSLPDENIYLSESFPSNTYRIGLYSGFTVLDDLMKKEMKYTGRLPDSDHEIMLVTAHCGLTEIRNTDERWLPEISTAIGDRIVLNGEEYTVCGLIEPDETADIQFPDGSLYSSSLYSIGNTSAVFLPETVSRLGPQTQTVVQLRYNNPDDLIPILSQLAENGVDINMIDVSDRTVFFDSYDSRFLNIHLSWHMAALPFALGILVFALLLALDTRSDRRELIILKCLGMTKAQLGAEQFCQAVFTAFSAVLILVLYGLLRFVTKEPWNIPIWALPAEFVISIAVFTLIYSAVLIAAGDLSFENMEE
jgi:hypothetical protein